MQVIPFVGFYAKEIIWNVKYTLYMKVFIIVLLKFNTKI